LLEMLPSEEFHRLLRCPAESVKDVILSHVPGPRHPIAALVDSTSESELAGAVGALGGHDIPLLIRALSEAREETARPVVVLAHTIKGWGLPMAGDPGNHSRLLTPEEIASLRRESAIADDEWPRFPEESAEGELCKVAARRLCSEVRPDRRLTVADVPQ